MNLRDLTPSWVWHGVVFGLLAGVAGAEPANVLRGDASFESGSPGGHFAIGTVDADGGFREADPGPPDAASFDRSTGVHGTSSIRLDVRPGKPAALRFEAPKAVALPCTASAYVRGGKAAANLRLVLADETAGVVAAAEMEPPNYWRRLAATLPAPEGDESSGAAVRPVVTIVAEAGEDAAVWIDAVQLEEGGEATPFAMAFPLTYGIRLSDADPPVTTAPLRLTGHVVNDTEYIAVCRVVAKLYPVVNGQPASELFADAEARVGMAPRQGKDAPLEFAPVPAGRYVAVINRADGPPEEEARIPLTVREGPPLSIKGDVTAGDPASVRVTVANRGDETIDGTVNVWLGPRPVQLDSVAIRLDPGGAATQDFQLPKTYDEEEMRLRVETVRGPVEITVPVPAAAAPADAAPSP